MNLEAIQFQTIVLSLNSKKTILVYNKEKEIFCTIGKGEVLDSKIYETKKEFIDLRIYNFIKDNKKQFLKEDIDTFKEQLSGRITQLEEKINGKFKRYFYIFISLFPFTISQSTRVEEKERLDQLIFEIDTEGFEEFYQPPFSAPASTVPTNLQPFTQNIFPQLNKNTILAGVELPPIPNPPFRIPPPPSASNTQKVIKLLEGEPPSPDIHPTLFKKLEKEIIINQIKIIEEYIEKSKVSLSPFTFNYEAIDEIKGHKKQCNSCLYTTRIHATDCEKKIKFFKEQLKNNAVATVKNGTGLFHFFPLARVNDILEYNNLEKIEINEKIEKSIDSDLIISLQKGEISEVEEPTPLPSNNDISKSTSANINKSIDNDDDWENQNESKNESSILDMTKVQKFLTHETKIDNNIPVEKQSKLKTEMKLLVLEPVIEELEEYLKNLNNEIKDMVEAIETLDSELNENKNMAIILTDQNQNTTKILFSDENLELIKALLEDKSKNIETWNRYLRMRETELTKREQPEIKKVIVNPAPPIKNNTKYPPAMIEEFPLLLGNTCPQTLIKLRKRIEITRNATASYIYENSPFFKIQPKID